ncbi:pyrimidine utilization flavin reductase protein F [Pseudonocardia ailaonensis]|uniref:Pyrimidine utilization flavin reductase protein F n=1 Tax=Pseudonocardia ailaonensis TaxID=367279 RepID=A0ABN2MR14_9PSEU
MTPHSPDPAEASGGRFRDGMARLGAAVNVVTSDGPAGRLGFTASAVCSVSDQPPTLLLCMNRRSTQNGPLRENGVFCVNSLAADQRPLSEVFAGLAGLAMPERFAAASWAALATGSPVLDGASASFDCEVLSVTEVATHSVIVGKVLAVQVGDTPSGLVYFGREYHAMSVA